MSSTLTGQPLLLRMPLSSYVYNTRLRVPKFNGLIQAITQHSDAGAHVLRRLAPEWTKADHQSLADYHRRRAQKLKSIWALVADRAIQQALGRPRVFTDYKITAICREEVADHHKRVLRHCAYQSTKHMELVHVHARLARARSTPTQKAETL